MRPLDRRIQRYQFYRSLAGVNLKTKQNFVWIDLTQKLLAPNEIRRHSKTEQNSVCINLTQELLAPNRIRT